MSLTVKLALSPLLVAQALLTRRKLPRLPEPLGERQGEAGQPGARPLRLLIAGDSSAAGVGVVSQREALSHQLAQRLAEALSKAPATATPGPPRGPGEPVHLQWRLVARSGMTTAQTLHLLQREPAWHADVAVVVTGVNDVVEQVPSHRAVSARETLANWLRNGNGVQQVVFAPLPPIHHFPGLPQPLRWVAGSDAHRHNRALRHWVATRGDVSCVDMEMPLNRGVMAADGFHPGEPVYRYCAGAIAHHIVTQVWPQLHLPAARPVPAK